MLRRLTLVLVLGLVGGACAQDDPPAETSSQPSATVASPSTSTPAPPVVERGSARVEELEAVDLHLTEIATLDAPVAMAGRPGHEALFVAERAGRIMVVESGGVRTEPLLEVGTTTDGERGLLGLVFSPDGARLYVSYTNLEGDSRLDEYTMGDRAADIDLASRRTLLAVDQPFSNHNGGHPVFGPDGFLYYGLGDGGGRGDPDGNAQDTSTLLGSVLRLDPRPQGDDAYAIPTDNPFVGGGGRAEIFLYGVRNPWRFSFDRATADLWLADVGQNAVEEVNLLSPDQAAGANLGWPALEGTRAYDGDPPPDAVPPVYEYTHDDGYSVTGGFVYRGRAIPALAGAYVFGDLGPARLWALAIDDGGVTGRADLGVGVEEGTLVSFFEDTDGELYVISIGGTISRLDPA